VKALRSKRSEPLYDPHELDELIHNPAVGLGIGSHLLSRVVPIATEKTNLSTVDRFNSPPPPAEPAGPETGSWVTEGGEAVPAARVRPIRTLQDVLNEAEQAVYDALGAGAAGETVTEMGYDQLARATGLARKTVQRVVAKLVQKDAVAVERPADIYARRPTLYRIFPPAAALERMAIQKKTHIAKIGPGFVFVRRGEGLNLSTVDRFNRQHEKKR
jgi:predicted transcriptional regulator